MNKDPQAFDAEGFGLGSPTTEQMGVDISLPGGQMKILAASVEEVVGWVKESRLTGEPMLIQAKNFKTGEWSPIYVFGDRVSEVQAEYED